MSKAPKRAKRKGASRASDRTKLPKGSPFSVHKQTGQLCKKFGHTRYYFGHISQHEIALKRFYLEWPRITAGLPRYDTESPNLTKRQVATMKATGRFHTVEDVCQFYVGEQMRRHKDGHIGFGAIKDAKKMSRKMMEVFGKNLDATLVSDREFKRLDRHMSQYAQSYRRKVLVLAKAAWELAVEEELFVAPIRFGRWFEPPSEAKLQVEIELKADGLIEPEVARIMLQSTDPQIRAATLLGLNAGYTAIDIGRMTFNKIDGFRLRDIRLKRLTARACQLWPETLTAIQSVVDARPRPCSPLEADLIFLSPTGRPVQTEKNPELSRRYSQAVKELVEREFRFTHKQLRKVTRTVGKASRDADAVQLVMGHTKSFVNRSYELELHDEKDRLQAVSKKIYKWLYGKKCRWPKKKPKPIKPPKIPARHGSPAKQLGE